MEVLDPDYFRFKSIVIVLVLIYGLIVAGLSELGLPGPLWLHLIIGYLIIILFLWLFKRHELNPFNPQDFKKAQLSGKTILLQFHAKWCPTCAEQQRSLMVLKRKPFKSVIAFEVDYDIWHDLRKEFSVETQATVIVLKGTTEVARATAETDKLRLTELISKGM